MYENTNSSEQYLHKHNAYVTDCNQLR